MDDIVVLILTLIFIIAGIFGQMKKRQVPAEPVGEDNSKRQNFWELLDDEEEMPGDYTKQMKPEKEAAREDRFHTAGNLMKRSIVQNISKIEPEKPKADIKGIKKFPLKQAVIYSEILNRKYF